jgi:hypothetical protein
MILRQGDVMLVKVAEIPAEVKPVAREQGLVILAHGEVTGHHHSFSSGSVALLEAPGGERFVTAKRPSVLRHQEHGSITLPPGNYRVVRQREYSPEAIRNVAD